jgi:hypothetical protein
VSIPQENQQVHQLLALIWVFKIFFNPWNVFHADVFPSALRFTRLSCIHHKPHQPSDIWLPKSVSQERRENRDKASKIEVMTDTISVVIDFQSFFRFKNLVNLAKFNKGELVDHMVREDARPRKKDN